MSELICDKMLYGWYASDVVSLLPWALIISVIVGLALWSIRRNL